MLTRARALALLLLALADCSIQLPQGKLACRADGDCPRGWRCLPPEAADGRCYPDNAPQLFDASTTDAALSVTTPPDMLPVDSGAPAPPPPDADSGSVDAAMPELPPTPVLPDHIRLPGPQCGQAPERDTGIFTSAGVGDDRRDCGDNTAPCRSPQMALDRASRNGLRYVYLDNTDRYVVDETLRLPPNVTVIGGFSNVSGRWARLCGDARTSSAHIVSTANPVIVASYDGDSKLDTLSIDGRSAGAGESMYGIVARGDKTRLWLRDVVVTAADGGDGVAGAAGTTTATPPMSCTPDDGANAMLDGAPGTAGVAGTFGAEGYQPGAGRDGAEGARGHAGTIAPAPVCASCMPDPICACSPINESCGARGDVGCGGDPGTGGRGGSGGAASIAVFVWDAVVDVAGGRLKAGRGGDGADGGDPGAGAAGLPGKKGAVGPTCTICGFNGDSCYLTNDVAGEGTLGGTGGSGSAGGKGGAGSGGVAYGVYRGGKAAVTVAADTRIEHGRAGRGPSGAAQGKAAPLGP